MRTLLRRLTGEDAIQSLISFDFSLCFGHSPPLVTHLNLLRFTS